MWLFIHPIGFLSVVKKDCASTELCVRARVFEDLHRLQDHVPGEIIERKDTDYPFRMLVDASRFAFFVAGQIKLINYANFKQHTSSTLGMKRADVYHDVWKACLALEEQTWKPKWRRS